jgi:hypothetical protein
MPQRAEAHITRSFASLRAPTHAPTGVNPRVGTVDSLSSRTSLCADQGVILAPQPRRSSMRPHPTHSGGTVAPINTSTHESLCTATNSAFQAVITERIFPDTPGRSPGVAALCAPSLYVFSRRLSSGRGVAMVGAGPGSECDLHRDARRGIRCSNFMGRYSNCSAWRANATPTVEYSRGRSWKRSLLSRHFRVEFGWTLSVSGDAPH